MMIIYTWVFTRLNGMDVNADKEELCVEVGDTRGLCNE